VQSPVVPLLERELIATGWAVRSGKVWTTDAPYRETKAQLNQWARDGVLAVEMQAASLFAFGVAKQASVASVAMVSNASIMREPSSIPAHRRMACEFSRDRSSSPVSFRHCVICPI